MRKFLKLLHDLKKVRAEYLKMAEMFDKRDNFYPFLERFFQAHGYIPKEYEADWQQHLRDPRPWRKIPGMRFGIWFTCLKSVLRDNRAAA